MADALTAERRSANMAKIRAKHTKPEMLVRRMVHGMGYRYRLHRTDLPGKPDLVFGPRRKIIFVHGCFWHLHDCRSGRIPKTRRGYWEAKLRRNAERDAEQLTALRSAGWQVLTVWECQTRDHRALRNRLAEFLMDEK